MIITETGQIKLSGVLLPGIFREAEVEREAVIDEVDVKGRAVNPREPVGYKQGAVKLITILKDEPPASKYDQLAAIERMFKTASQEVPFVHTIVDAHCNARGIDTVVFSKIKSKNDNQSDLLKVTIEFVEYVPIVITATEPVPAALKSQTTQSTPAVSDEFAAYLSGESTTDYKKALDAAVASGKKYAAAHEAQAKLEQNAKEAATQAAVTSGKRYAAAQESYETAQAQAALAAAQKSGERYAAYAAAYSKAEDKSVQYAANDDDDPRGGRRIAV